MNRRGLMALMVLGLVVVAIVPGPRARPADDPAWPLAAVAGPVPLAAATPDPVVGSDLTGVPTPTDPFPILRIFVPTGEDSPAASRFPGRVARRMPRDDFEARVRSAAAAVAGSENPPRLVSARYQGRVTDDGLAGTGEWTIAYPAGVGGLISLDPLGLAVCSPRWAGRSAVMYYPSTVPESPAVLWADRPDEGTLSFDWSAAGVEEPGAERYTLVVPSVPVATLDLDLDRRREPVVSAGVLLTGPYPGTDKTRRRWTLAFGGLDRVELGIRLAGTLTEVGSPVRDDRSAEYTLRAAEASCEFEFDLAAIRGPVSEYTLDVDPRLRISRVESRTPGVSVSWRAEGPIVHVTPSEAATTVRLRVSGVAAMSPAWDRPWPLPQVRLAGGLPGADAVTVRVDPDLSLVTCDPGDYRIASTTALGERGYQIDMVASLPRSSNRRPARRPPAVRVRWADPVFATTEDVRWQIKPGRTELTARVRVRATRGPLADITFRSPAGYKTRGVTMSPDDPGVEWTTGPRPGTVTIRPSRAIPTSGAVEVNLVMSGPDAPPAAELYVGSDLAKILSFPHVAPVGAVERAGVYTIACDPGLSANIAPTLVGEAIPTRPPGTLFSSEYRGEQPSGTVLLRPGVARGKAIVEVDPTAGRTDTGDAVATFRYRVSCDDGEFGALTLLTPTADGLTWEVTAETPIGTDVRRLVGGQFVSWVPLAGGLSPWAEVAAGGTAVVRPYDLWRITFPRPVGEVADVLATSHFPRRLADVPRTTVPMPSLCGVDPARSTIQLNGAAALRYEPVVEPGADRLALRPRGVARSAGTANEWQFADATLLTRVGSDGMCDCVLSTRVTQQAARVLEIGLPPGTTPTAVKCDGYTVSPSPSPDSPDGPVVSVPLPAGGATGVGVEVRYQLRCAEGTIVTTADSPFPTLAGHAIDGARSWDVDPTYLTMRRIVPFDSESPVIDSKHEFVRSAYVSACGYTFAGLVLAIGLALMTARSRVGFRVLCGIVGIVGAVTWMTPSVAGAIIVPPLVAGLVVLVAYRVTHRPNRRGTGSTVSYRGQPESAHLGPLAPSSGLGLVAALLVMPGLAAVAQAPGPAVVYLIPTESGAGPDRLDAIVPESVLDRLDALVAPPVSGAVVTSAEYDGAAMDATVSFTAVLNVHCPTDGPHRVTLPFADVRLGELFLDGQLAYPDVDDPDQYVFAVSGRGDHTLLARFDVPLAALGSDREVRFGIPAVPACRVRFTPPAGVLLPEVTTARGSQTFYDGRVAADHGGGREVVVRWRDEDAGGAKATVTVREASLWDLWESTARITAAFAYRIDGGSVTRLQIELPGGSELGPIVVRPTDPESTGSPPGLRNWKLSPSSGGRQRLTLDLRAPTSGRVTVVVTLYPQMPPTVRHLLQFPSALGVADADSYYALRARSLAIDDVTRVGMIDYPADAIAKEFAALAPELDLGQLPASRVFRRTDGPPPRVVPTLRPPVGTEVGTADVTWDVGDTVRGTGSIVRTADTGSRGWVEFDLSESVQLQDVRTPDLAGWGRYGERVQVWLKKPAKSTRVRWTGTLSPRPGESDRPNTTRSLDLPTASADPTKPVPTTVTVRAIDGWTVQLGENVDLTPTPTQPLDLAWSYLSSEAVVGPFMAYPPATDTQPLVLGVLARSDTEFVYRTDVSIPTSPDRPRAFAVQFPGLSPKLPVDIHTSPGVRMVEVQARPTGRAWEVVVPPEATGAARVTVTVRGPDLPTDRLPLPVLWAGDRPLPTVSRWLAVGPGLELDPWGRDVHPSTSADLDRLRTEFPSVADAVLPDRVFSPPEWAESVRAIATVGVPESVPGLMRRRLPVPAATVDTPSPDPIDATWATVGGRWPAILGAAVWVIGMIVVATVLARPTAWPGRLAVCGLLGALVIGVDEPVGPYLFGVAVVGGLVGLARAAFRTLPGRR